MRMQSNWPTKILATQPKEKPRSRGIRKEMRPNLNCISNLVYPAWWFIQQLRNSWVKSMPSCVLCFLPQNGTCRWSQSLSGIHLYAALDQALGNQAWIISYILVLSIGESVPVKAKKPLHITRSDGDASNQPMQRMGNCKVKARRSKLSLHFHSIPALSNDQSDCDVIIVIGDLPHTSYGDVANPSFMNLCVSNFFIL